MTKELLADQDNEYPTLQYLKNYLSSLTQEEKEKMIENRNLSNKAPDRIDFYKRNIDAIPMFKSILDNIIKEYDIDLNHPDIVEVKEAVELCFDSGIHVSIIIEYCKNKSKEDKRTRVYDAAFMYYGALHKAKKLGLEITE